MKRQQPPNQSNIYGESLIEEEKHVDLQTLNQHFLTQTTFFVFLLILVAMLNNTAKAYDYNVAVGGGLYFLSTLNPVLYKMPYFYILVGLTICADGIAISLLIGKLPVVHAIVVPAIQIVLKLLILVFEGLRFLRQSRQQQGQRIGQGEIQSRLKNHKDQKGNLVTLTKQQFEQRQAEYMKSKKLQPLNPNQYYLPINQRQNKQNFATQHDYSNQAYRQFNGLQFEQGAGKNR